MDSDVPGIIFDDSGICNYCKVHDKTEKQYPLDNIGRQKFHQVISNIKRKGKNKKYDCVIGISGGVDSTYLLYITKKLGLRPRVVHLDNGWNSDTAINNIKNIVAKYNIDLKIVMCDMEEFKDLQLSFLKASVPDMEIPTDHAITSILYQVASQEGIPYIIAGHNYRTEGKVPVLWSYGDSRYIKSVYKIFGKNKKLRKFQNMSPFKFLYYSFIKRIKSVRLLYYFDYQRDKIKKIIEKEFAWQDYGGKHHESIYTRFTQSYILPEKFGIDKRKIHFSALIRSNQMTREEALKKIKESPISEKQAKEDKEYIIDKLGITHKEFERIMSLLPKTFLDYQTYYSIIKRFLIPIKLFYRLIYGSIPPILHLMESEQKKRNNR